MLKISAIQTNPNNPRLIKDERFKKLVENIKRYPKFLAKRPIVIDSWDNPIILGGNMRYKALQELGYKEIPDDWVKEAKDFTDEEKRAFIILDNIEFGENDWDTLAIEWDKNELKDWGLELPVNFKGEAEEDDYEIPDEIETDIITGDLFEIGQHRLLCGDSTNADDVAKVMGVEMADVVVTSPPYNQKLNKFKPSGMQKESPAFVHRMAASYADDISEEDYQAQQVAMIELVKSYLNKHGSFFYNHKIRYRNKVIISPYDWLKDTSLNIRQEIIWDRGSSITMNAKMFIPADERIYWMTVSDSFIFNDSTEIKSWTNIWKVAAKNEVNISAPFALEIPFRCIKSCTAEGNTVLEPYCDSGTTMVAAHQLNRKCIGIEISPQYCQVIVDRMLKLAPDLEVKRNGKPYIKVVSENNEKTTINA